MVRRSIGLLDGHIERADLIRGAQVEMKSSCRSRSRKGTCE
jgi:hypothetical protein